MTVVGGVFSIVDRVLVEIPMVRDETVDTSEVVGILDPRVVVIAVSDRGQE